MTESERYLNELLMKEIGLDVGQRMRLIDQDTGVPLTYKGKDIVSPNALPNNNVIVFDCYNSTALMQKMFGYYTKKYEDDNGISLDRTYMSDTSDGKCTISITDSENNTITSSPYQRDTLRYMDLIMRLNGDDNPNLEKYDIPKNGSKKQNRGRK